MSGLVRAEPLFRARRRAQRRRTARSLVAAATATTVVGGTAWVALYSPVLRATGVTVEGTSRLTAEQVLAAARVPLGGSLLRVPTTDVQARVATLAPVAAVRVVRDWPHRVSIDVTERVPVASVPTPAGSLLVDATGTAFATSDTVGGLLDLRVPAPAVGASNDATRAALAVWAELPPALRASVTSVAATTADAVELHLATGATVAWGSPADATSKLDVLGALMRHRAHVYDVSTPDVPVTR